MPDHPSSPSAINLKEIINPSAESCPIAVVGLTPCIQRTLIFQSLEMGGVHRATKVMESASGKGTNVARILSQLGVPATLISVTGGIRGEHFQRMIKHENFRHVLIPTESETRICQTLIDESMRRVTELVEESPLLETRVLDRVIQNVEGALDSAGFFVLSGSPPPGSDPDLYQNWIVRLQASGHRAFIDTQKLPLIHSLKARPYFVKANRDEWQVTFARKFSSESDIFEFLTGVVGTGVHVAVMTLGPEGACCVHGTNRYRIHHPEVQALNPIGSGDAMMAGIVAALSCRADLPQALQLGTACAIANTATQVSGDVRLSDIEKLLAEISIHSP